MLEFFFNEDSGKPGVPHWKCVLLCVYVCVCVCVCVWRVEVGKGEIEDVLKILVFFFFFLLSSSLNFIRT